MNDIYKQKMERLKEQARIKAQRLRWMENELLQECLSALNTYVIVDDENLMNKVFDIASNKKDVEMHSHKDEVLLDDEQKYYIVWDELSLPLVLCLGERINNCWDDVMAVSFDTYFVNESMTEAIGVRN
ncbi:hypothetical protein D6853_05530 [Butyrivibrio sp. X503]|uniref:CDI toxin immunity protein n=1 Tax=Butyrivibrio sp. X503 TaxID=2364878 RepID=UPI000EA8C32F|nr:hypothetical protein [Butyrivibrio sp. X503]MBR4670063.1 hypothetical protein [Butyrivibrio sp.]RKM56255.1 hypothetical protein D6853_05530 [Butyrivibrio sp. X503]